MFEYFFFLSIPSSYSIIPLYAPTMLAFYLQSYTICLAIFKASVSILSVYVSGTYSLKPFSGLFKAIE